ncbi:flagellar assembly protein FliW [Bacillus sp. 2205SS5-2]|uniref:flagellar assembly protein FliW n=1 Tax=Bacillus sp. 2205SS5-2 TaxID=3109031 RepID=UPI003004D607
MKIQTQYHGETVIDSTQILMFGNGLPGFPEQTQFILLPLPDNDVFFVLQSCNISSVAFIVTNPFQFFSDYDFKLDDSIVEKLDIQSEADVIVYTILTVQEPFSKSTANLQAPLIINRQTNKAKQVILNDTTYQTKHALFNEQASVKE